MSKSYIRRNKWNILLFLLALLITILSFKYNLILQQPENIVESFSINILTIDSIFAGFLFTGLGIMISISDKPRICDLDIAGYMDNYYNSIYIALIFLLISTVATLGFINIARVHYLLVIQQLALIFGVMFFIKSVWDIIKIVEKVRKSIRS